jgi:hypothetical protein
LITKDRIIFNSLTCHFKAMHLEFSDAVKATPGIPIPTEREIESSIAAWLRGACDRQGGRDKRRQLATQKKCSQSLEGPSGDGSTMN